VAIAHDSNDPAVAAVYGESTAAGGLGVSGKCATGHGIHGESDTSRGVFGSSTYQGVYGQSTTGTGVAGKSDVGRGVEGKSAGGQGVYGESATGAGLEGKSADWIGVYGSSAKAQGVYGASAANVGVHGHSTSGRGVVGSSDTWQGVYGSSKTNAGVVGESDEFDGVFGVSKKATSAGVSGHNSAGGLAGYFEGNVSVAGDVVVTGDVRLENADCAEDFDVATGDPGEPGTVMVMCDEGTLRQSERAYDRRVAGVVSGAGSLRPGLILDRQSDTSNRRPIALLGKVICKVDATYGRIEIGDLLASSPTAGHAMKAGDSTQAFGAVIGKALRSFDEGRGTIPILISLQ